MTIFLCTSADPSGLVIALLIIFALPTFAFILASANIISCNVSRNSVRSFSEKPRTSAKEFQNLIMKDNPLVSNERRR